MTASNSFNREQLLACARGEMFGKENAHLPSDPMLMFDRITHISTEGGKYGKGVITAELDIHPELWQLAGFFLPWLGELGRGRALGAGEIKFSGQVLPTAKLVSYTIDIARVIRGKLKLVIADASMSVDGREIYIAKNLRVGLFTSTESF